MSKTLRVDWIAPPFAGHLFPMLDLIGWLNRDFRKGYPGIEFDINVLSTESAARHVSKCNLPFTELLKGCDQQVMGIANYPAKVGSNPKHLLAQLRVNLSLMKQMQQELAERWSTNDLRPDLVVADFTVPVAGLTAKRLGIHWWTAIASPCAMEIPGSVPAYLGGWSPGSGLIHRLRDAVGRSLVKRFKLSVGWLFRKQLLSLGIQSIYREDAMESIYSSECVIAYGLREFEFANNWPEHVHFIGPCTQPPPQNCPVEPVSNQRIGVLVSLGTHLSWAKQSALQIIQAVAEQMPEYEFHFSMGSHAEYTSQRVQDNLVVLNSVPYDERLRQYKVAIVHGGTGLVYACIQNGLPMLVWPHDFDQFDHAARVNYHGLGLWQKPRVDSTVDALRKLVKKPEYKESLKLFQSLIQSVDRREVFRKLFDGIRPNASPKES